MSFIRVAGLGTRLSVCWLVIHITNWRVQTDGWTNHHVIYSVITSTSTCIVKVISSIEGEPFTEVVSQATSKHTVNSGI